jgi:hypothetical protein
MSGHLRIGGLSRVFPGFVPAKGLGFLRA